MIAEYNKVVDVKLPGGKEIVRNYWISEDTWGGYAIYCCVGKRCGNDGIAYQCMAHVVDFAKTLEKAIERFNSL